MHKKALSRGDVFILLANLAPLAGVWFLNWEPRQMFLVYCVETIIIGFYNVIRMLIAGMYKKQDTWETNDSKKITQPFWFFILFFIVHYGFFVFIQINIFAGVSGWSNDSMGFGFIRNIPSLLTDYSKLVLFIFIGIYGVKMFTDFIDSGEYRKGSLGLLMFQPYGRIFVQQFVVILGSMFLNFGAGKIFMLIFVIVKIYFEVFINFEVMIEKAKKEKETNQA